MIVYLVFFFFCWISLFAASSSSSSSTSSSTSFLIDKLERVHGTRRSVVQKILDGDVRDFTAELNALRWAQQSLWEHIDGGYNLDGSIDVRDEYQGLEKDIAFLKNLQKAVRGEYGLSAKDYVYRTNLRNILAPFHPISEDKFYEELKETKNLLTRLVQSASDEQKWPMLISDWDGTLKAYCSQYASNFQPAYSGVTLALFAKEFTRFTAILTAGPLQDTGILDLTTLPTEDGPVHFSGSVGRESWVNGRRREHTNDLPSEGLSVLKRFKSEMEDFFRSNPEFSLFRTAGSGFQQKVDRFTLGTQTPMKSIPSDLYRRYVKAITDRVRHVDPNREHLEMEQQELEMNVIVKQRASDSKTWTKANGIRQLVESAGESLRSPGFTLVCGDTGSDVPMLEEAVRHNPHRVMSIFVGAKYELRERVWQVLPDAERVCFVSNPDVIHCAFAEIVKEFKWN